MMETNKEDLKGKTMEKIVRYFMVPNNRREPYVFSLGDAEVLKKAFITCFTEYDRGLQSFQWMDEYDQVVEWMADNKGKGLYLCGSKGRGKSNIIRGVILPMYKIVMSQIISGEDGYKYADRQVIFGGHASDLPTEVTKANGEKGWRFESYRDKKIAYIDELGTERMATWYGEKIEPVRQILDWAEENYNVLIISSNLDSDTFLTRYGERSLDRLQHLCKIITFKGKSLR